MSGKRTVVKSVTLNLFSDGALGVATTGGMTERDVVGMLHAALGMTMRNVFSEKEAAGKGEAVQAPRVVVPKVMVSR